MSNSENSNEKKQEEIKDEKISETEINEDKNLKTRKKVSKNDMLNHIDLSIYNELDDFAAEVLDTDNFLKYVEARREYLFEAEEAVKKYFGEENSRFVGMELEYDLSKMRFPTAKFLVYRSWEITVSIDDIERGGTMNYGVNIGKKYSLITLVPYKVSERISFNDWSEDIQESLEVLDEYLIWRMTDAQKKTFGIPLDKEVLKED